MTSVLRAAWELPRPADAPGRVWRDWVLVGALAVLMLIEAALRPGLPGLWPSVVVGLGLIVALLWRRTHPGLVVLIAFGAMLLTDAARQFAGIPPIELYSMAFLLILPYALVRWGSGREIVLVGALMLVAMALTFVVVPRGLDDIVGGIAVVTASITLGVVFRTRAAARTQRAERVRLEERARLARDLHDTVAHHVSAISISAQAGRAAAADGPDAAVEALRVIESEARAALREMRSVVQVLRDEGDAALAPGPRPADLRALAGSAPGPAVSLRIDGDLESVPAPIVAVLYRLVQESITNARTHAVDASGVDVELVVAEDAVRARIHDDGRPVNRTGGASRGFGVIGMVERAELFGGTCRAGVDPAGGWTVEAELPMRNGAA